MCAAFGAGCSHIWGGGLSFRRWPCPCHSRRILFEQQLQNRVAWQKLFVGDQQCVDRSLFDIFQRSRLAAQDRHNVLPSIHARFLGNLQLVHADAVHVCVRSERSNLVICPGRLLRTRDDRHDTRHHAAVPSSCHSSAYCQSHLFRPEASLRIQRLQLRHRGRSQRVVQRISIQPNACSEYVSSVLIYCSSSS